MAKISTDAVINWIRVKLQGSAPASPAANYGYIYEKSDKKLYFKNEDGTETDLTAGAGVVDDTAYDATSWNGVTTIAPSKNAVRDKIEALGSGSVDDTAYDATSWNGDTTHAPSKNAVRDKIETLGGSSGALVLLEQHTASASASLAFTSGISATYDDYIIEIVDLVVATDNVDLKMQYSADGGSSYETGSNYFSAGNLIKNDAGLTTQGANPGAHFVLGAGVDNGSDRSYQGTIHIRSMASTVLGKQIYGTVIYSNQSFVVGGAIQGLLNVPGTAYNAFKIFASSGNLASGTIRLYGIAKT